MSIEAESLPTVQRWMQDALRFPAGADRADAEMRLDSSGRLAAADGLAVYQRNYFLRISRCIREQFPALCHALGAALFDDFVAEYIRARPPESYTLYDLGRRFADFLDESRPDRDLPSGEREAWIDFMVDLACFERQVFTMFDAPGQEGRPLAGVDVPDDRLRLQPCFALGTYRFAVPAYYHAVRLGEAPALPAAGPSFAALVRTDYVTRTIPLTEPHYLFLAAMKAGGTVEDGISAMAAHIGAAPDAVRRAWRTAPAGRQRWIAWGFFIAAD